MVFKSAQMFSSFLWYSLQNLFSLSYKFALIGHQLCPCFLYVPQQFVYKSNSRTLLSVTHCTQCKESLIAFCNGNSTQNSSFENLYGIQKQTNVQLLLSVVFSAKSVLIVLKLFCSIGHQFCLCFLYVLQQFAYKINSRMLLSGT